MRHAFTMIEIIFVLVITGLVAAAGSMAIVQIMQNYAIQKEYAKLELDSTSTLRQVSRYLQNSVWESIATLENNNYFAVRNISEANNGSIGGAKRLIFIEKNMNVVNGFFSTHTAGVADNANLPYFSGFVDLLNSNGRTIRTGSTSDKLTELRTLAAGGKIALYFPFVSQSGVVFSKFYSANQTSLYKIDEIINDTNMKIDRTPPRLGDIATIVNTTPVIISRQNENLQLQVGNSTALLAQNVTGFFVWSEAQAGLLRVRICFANKTMDFMPEFCKEGVVMQ